MIRNLDIEAHAAPLLPPHGLRARRVTDVSAGLGIVLFSAAAMAGASEDAVRKVEALMAEQRWEEAILFAREAPIREATRASLIGVVAMRTGAHERAIASFRRALELGPKRPSLYLYLAWSHYSLDQRKQARNALAQVKRDKARAPLYWILRGRLARDAGDSAAAYRILLQGNERFAENRLIARELGYVLVAFGALDEAPRHLVPALSGAGDDARLWSDAMRLLRVLGDRGHYDEALMYTEILRARLPGRAAKLDAIAAHLHARAQRPVAAARLFARASRSGSESFAFEAADQYRVARMTEQALRWNGRVVETPRRLEQRFLILTEAGRWSRAAVAGRELDAAGRLRSRSLRYRYGLALLLGFRNLEAARRVVDNLGAAAEAERLRNFVERCERTPGRCR